MKRSKLAGPARMARSNYFPRVVFMAIAGLLILAAMPSGYRIWPFWVAWVGLFVVWPHLAYVFSLRYPNSRRPEQFNIHFDGFSVGIWSALTHYSPMVMLLFVIGTTLTHTTINGSRGVAQAVVYFALGAILGGGLTGFQFDLATTLAEQMIAFLGVFIIIMMLVLIIARVNQRLLKVRRKTEAQNRIFRAMHELSIVATSAETIDQLLDQILAKLSELMNHSHFALVLTDPGRHESIRFMRSIRMSAVTGREITQFLVHNPEPEAEAEVSRSERGTLFLLAMRPHLRQVNGYLAVETNEHWGDDFRGATQLFLDQMSAILEGRLLQRRLKRLAETDALTGVYNRAVLESALAEVRQRHRDDNTCHFSIIILDVNGLKAINDEQGHEAGDRVIVATARLLMAVVREGDLVFRLGGDEFLILCAPCSSTQVLKVAERLRAAERRSNEASAAIPNNNIGALSFSIGHASSDEIEPGNVMSLADQRMYTNKTAFYKQNQRYRRPLTGA